jgi:hypothetical protein
MVMLAVELVDNGLERFTPGAFPERPIDLPVDDEKIADAIAGARSAHPSREDTELVRRFVAWKVMLMTAEGRSKDRLKFLVGCWEDLRCYEDPYLRERAGIIDQHVASHWPQVDMANVPPKHDPASRDLWFGKAVRRVDLVSSWLLYGLPSPRFSPMVESQDDDAMAAPHWSDR